MPRGITEATKLKQALKTERRYQAAYATVSAEQKLKALQAIGKLDIMLVLKGKFLDALDRLDPLELVAFLGTTYIIKQGIEWTETVIADPSNAKTLIMLINPFLGLLYSQIVQSPPPEVQKKIEQAMDSLPAELFEWLLSATAAFFIVRYGKQAIGSVIDQAKSLLGIAALAA